MGDLKCKKCGFEVRPHLAGSDGGLCFACVTRRSGRSSRLRRLMSVDLVDVGSGGNCIYCRASFERNRIGLFLSDGKICEGCAYALRDYSGKSFADIAQSLPREWLLKSVGRIFGPYSQPEVEEKLLQKEIVPLDEIARPFERWKYIRDEVTFAKTVETLRIRGIGQKEDTATNTLYEKSGTGEMTLTQEMTSTNTDPSDTDKNLIDVRARVVAVSRGDTNKDVKSYGLSSESAVVGQINNSAKYYWILPVVAVLVFFIGWRQVMNKYYPKGESFEEIYRKGIEARDIGDHVSALKYFRSANQMRPRDSEAKIQLAPLLINIDRETNEAVRLLNSLLETEHSPELLREIHLNLALASMFEDQFAQADDYLSKALKSDNHYVPALINRAYIFLKDRKFTEAIDTLNRVKEPAGSHAYAAKNILLAMALVNQGASSGNRDFIKKAQDIIKKYIVRFDNYKQEALFIKMFAQFKDDSKHVSFSDILDVDPELTANFVQDLLLFPYMMDWEQLFPWCEEVYKQGTKSTELTALFAYCLMRVNRTNDSKQAFEEALLQGPDHSLVGAVYGYFLLAAGKDSEAMAEMKLSATNPKYKLPFLLRARTCFQAGNFGCSKDEYEGILKKYPDDITAMAGLANSYWKLGDRTSAQAWLNKGIRKAKKYRPLLRLKRELGREN